MRKVIINGYFTAEYTSGIPRYATEIIKRMDKYFSLGEAELVVPNGASNVPELQNIKVIVIGDISNGTLWGNRYYKRYVQKNNGICINFTNRAENIKKSISAIHDTIPLRKEKFNIQLDKKTQRKLISVQIRSKIAFLWKTNCKKRNAEYIVTVSEYSRKCIVEQLKINPNKIKVIGNGWEHIKDVVSIDEKFDKRISTKNYFLTLGNLFPHKNIKWVLEEAEKMPNEIFVIAGKMPYNFIESFKIEMPNVIFLGYVSESYMKYLMQNCKALLFPSLEEGFGIPPLEALALGTQVIASDIPVMHEIYKESIHYINPIGDAVDLNKVLCEKVSSSEEILKDHSWEKSTKMWVDLIRNTYSAG